MIKLARYLLFVLASTIIISSCQTKKSTVTYEQILGYWKTVVGDNEFVNFEKVDSEYVYSAFTYDRLAASGTWELDNGVIHIIFDHGESVDLKVSFKNDTMIFNNGSEKYVRVILSSDGKTPVSETNDLKILEQVIANVNVIFSDIEPFTEEWVNKDIKWQKITTDVILQNEGFTDLVEVANMISKYLVNQGFDIDTTNTSEIINSYKKGKLRVMVRTRSSNEATTGETTYVDVISGIEN